MDRILSISPLLILFVDDIQLDFNVFKFTKSITEVFKIVFFSLVNKCAEAMDTPSNPFLLITFTTLYFKII
jgi:hypothetical protein